MSVPGSKDAVPRRDSFLDNNDATPTTLNNNDSDFPLARAALSHPQKVHRRRDRLDWEDWTHCVAAKQAESQRENDMSLSNSRDAVVYSDAVAAQGFVGELANYAEYSGAPTEGQTYEYACIPIKVYSPDTHITGTGTTTPAGAVVDVHDSTAAPTIVHFDTSSSASGSRPAYRPFDDNTRRFVYGLQLRAIQGMLDFDYSCGRKAPSVAAMIYPFGGHHIQKFYWGTKETLLPVYTSVDEAVAKHPDPDVIFASSRSVYSSTLDILKFSSQIRSTTRLALPCTTTTHGLAPIESMLPRR
ncbi:hypothetical protein R3P38DRAFT_3472592 [Favolaschia claudopus]|uniref:Uncharacterized protein n=1 Tax=Favolaschia claudopus TaxID=2862362 RepID=A0AAV9ZCJ7_9AGAR